MVYVDIQYWKASAWRSQQYLNSIPIDFGTKAASLQDRQSKKKSKQVLRELAAVSSFTTSQL